VVSDTLSNNANINSITHLKIMLHACSKPFEVLGGVNFIAMNVTNHLAVRIHQKCCVFPSVG